MNLLKRFLAAGLARIGATLVLASASLISAGPAQAHKASDAYLSLRIDGAKVEQRFDIALRDLDRELALDADDDGQIRWGEVRRRWAEIVRLADSGLDLRFDGQACTRVSRALPQLDTHSDGRYAVLQQSLHCPAKVSAIRIDYRLFATSDASHRGIARISARIDAESEQSAVLVPGGGVQEFRIGTAADPPVTTLSGFVIEGMHHIAVGIDHILFLVTLLMVAVWRREGAGWVVRASAASAWRETLRLVTAFTIAHSLTLGLAAAGVLAPPSRWIEALIAASVFVAAVDNLWPFVRGPRWLMVSFFGLVHGFGFAGPLQALGLDRSNLALPLFGFNLGVEIGQLAIVALLLPLACWLREARFYRLAVVRGGSTLVAGVAAVWMVERGFEISLWP
jgi:hypothetical protein